MLMTQAFWPCSDCCNGHWAPSWSGVGDSCLGAISYLPAWFALLVVLCRYALGPAWRRRPLWLRTFAAEPKDATDAARDEGLETPDLNSCGDEDLPLLPKVRAWHWPAVCILTLSVLGLAFGLVLTFAFGFGPVFLVPVVPCLLTALIVAIDRPRTAPGAVLLVQGALLAVQTALAMFIPATLHWPSGLFSLTQLGISLCIIVTVLAMPLRDPRLDARDICLPFETPTYRQRSPEDVITPWQWMTVSWMSPLISIAFNRQLHDEDVWLLPYEFQHLRLHLLFREVRGSVTARILKANMTDLIITSCLGILESVASLLPIVLLKQLLSALQGPQRDARTAIVYAMLMAFCNLVRDQSGVFSLWYSRRCYERSRGEMITMIYEKTLRRKAFTFPGHHDGDAATTPDPSRVEGPASMGKILNLMRNDVYEVAQRFWEFPSLFIKPMNFILSLVLIWNILGPASLLGILIVVAAQVVNGFVLRVLYRWEVARRAVTDLKLQATSQFVEAIRHLRWYDWQDKWLARIILARNKELRWRVANLLLQRAVDLMNQLAAFFFPVAAFYAYTVIGKRPLSVDIAFPALSLFTILQTSLRELPALITVLVNAAVAMRRIEGFMAEPNKEEHFEDRLLDPTLGELEIKVAHADFSWPGSQELVLRDVNLEIGPGLTLVCGKVGCGKTALLHAILGELDQSAGEKKVPEEMIGYCTQTPWLQSMSIRENILFSAPYDERRYRQVLDACCLLPDLVNFKAGDLSLIGENGVGLSGGQKARVALARAVYSRARMLLLDDPIAALDHNTAEAIMGKLFKTSGLMKDRLVVFVTHRVDLVSKYAVQTLEVGEDGTVQRVEEDLLDLDSKLLHKITSNEEVPVEDDEEGENEAIPDKFIEEEYRAHGRVMASVYWRYVKAGKLRWWAAIILCFILFRVTNVAYYYFLKIWGEAYDSAAASEQPRITAQTAVSSYGVHSRVSDTESGGWFNYADLGLPSPDDDVRPWLFWFLMLSIAQVVVQLLSDLVLIVLTYKAGKKIFEQVMQRVSNATFRFFDVTPVGRLMNRVTSDIGTIDGQIAYQIYQVAYHGVVWVSAMAVIASTTPVFLVLALATTASFVLIFRRFLPATQSLRRLEMVSLSPLMSNFGTLLEGLTTVRAFRAQPHFQNRIIVTTDAFQKMDHFYWSLQAWLLIRLDALGALSSFLLTLVAVRSGLSSGTVAFVLATAANFVDTTHAMCRKYGDLQMQFVSVERVIELLDLEQEEPGDVQPPAAWPAADDDVVFEGATVRYAPHLEPSLRGVSVRIPARSTVAVTGRTGSGKSTLALALLGTVLAHGDGEQGGGGGSGIRIGAMDVGRVDKHALRRRISFVAQDPVLFPGTLRENLDPVGEHSDGECAAVLERVMRESGGGGGGAGGGEGLTLGSRVDGGGKNLSQGQRQLVGLGRAVLRRSPVVILDEATASIDMKTAFYIQQVLREELRDSTVITIAHRLEAVKDADFSIVLDKGQVVYAGPVGGGQAEREEDDDQEEEE